MNKGIKSCLYGVVLLASSVSFYMLYGAAEAAKKSTQSPQQLVKTLSDTVKYLAQNNTNLLPLLKTGIEQGDFNSYKESVVNGIDAIQKALTDVLTAEERTCDGIPTEEEDSRIHLIWNIAEILPCVQQGSLVIFDVDSVLVEKQGVLMDCLSFLNISRDYLQQFSRVQSILIDMQIRSTLEKIRAKGAHIIAVSTAIVAGTLEKFALGNITDQFDAVIASNGEAVAPDNTILYGVRKIDGYDEPIQYDSKMQPLAGEKIKYKKYRPYGKVDSSLERDEAMAMGKITAIKEYIRLEYPNPTNIIFVEDTRYNLKAAQRDSVISSKNFIPMFFVLGFSIKQFSNALKYDMSSDEFQNLGIDLKDLRYWGEVIGVYSDKKKNNYLESTYGKKESYTDAQKREAAYKFDSDDARKKAYRTIVETMKESNQTIYQYYLNLLATP